MSSLWLWIGFNLLVLLMLALDLGVLHRHAKAISLREATVWSILWVLVALVFNFSMLYWYPPELPGQPPPDRGALALQFFTGYLIERALSIDNIFVFLVLFSYFSVEPRYQYRVLFWGILGALVMRGAMIAMGVALISRFSWILYVFGAFLVWTGLKLLFHKAEDIHPEHNPVLKWVRKYVPLTKEYHGQQFFVREGGIWRATPMFLVLVVVETTDLAFALDSIPAIFAITRDPFIIYSSNVFAILGLRALYFLLAGAMPYFRYLNVGLSLVLVFIGVKMLIIKWVHIPIALALGIVGGVLATSVLASLVAARREQRRGSGAARPAADWIAQLASPERAASEAAASELYGMATRLAEPVLAAWRADAEFAALLRGAPTVGIAVGPERFTSIHKMYGEPLLAEVPADQDAREFELHLAGPGGIAFLDVLTTRAPDAGGAIARFLEKSGEGIQQVEFPVAGVDRATEILRSRFGVHPVYPATRPGANGTRVNFFLVPAAEGKKVLIELVEGGQP